MRHHSQEILKAQTSLPRATSTAALGFEALPEVRQVLPLGYTGRIEY
jgi:hypothetical protein